MRHRAGGQWSVGDPHAAPERVRRASLGLTVDQVSEARRATLTGEVADSPQVARLVVALSDEHRRHGALGWLVALTIGLAAWATVRLAAAPLHVATWVLVVLAVLLAVVCARAIRGYLRAAATEQANASVAAGAPPLDDTVAVPAPRVSVGRLLRREVPALIVQGVLFALLDHLTNGRPLTVVRVVVITAAWTVLMVIVTLAIGWYRARTGR